MFLRFRCLDLNTRRGGRYQLSGELIFDLSIKTERFSIKIAPKHIIFDYLWDKKETNKLFRLVCLFWSECNYRISENTDISMVCWWSARGIHPKLNGQAQ